MIVIGVLLFVFGIVMYYSGVNTNNSIDAQMESFFNEGYVDPGEPYEVIGIIFMVVGIILIILGVVKSITDSNKIDGGSEREFDKKKENVKNTTKKCSFCGEQINDDVIFCPKCGNENSNFKYCPKCNSRVDRESDFCVQCGAEFILYRYSLCDSSEKELVDFAFKCIEKAEFNDAKQLLNSKILFGSRNPYISYGKLLVQFELENEDYLDTSSTDFSNSKYYTEIMNSDDELLKGKVKTHYERYLKNSEYNKACKLADVGAYKEAIIIFKSLENWKDSKEKVVICKKSENNELRTNIILSVIFVLIVVVIFLFIYIAQDS